MQPSSFSSPRLRFLVAGPLSPRPSGRRGRLVLAELAERLTQSALALEVDVGPALGAANPVKLKAKFSRFRDFSAAELVQQGLGELHRLRERLVAPSGRPRSDELLAVIARIAGRGPLHAELAACFAPPPEKPADPTGGDLVEELLARGSSSRSEASSAIDAVVRGVVQSTPAGAAAEPARAAHAVLSAALSRAALAVLADPGVRAAEVRWRALRLFLGQCPRDQDLAVDLLDVDAAGLPAALAELGDLDPLARPDAIFLLDPVATLAEAEALAEVAADLHAPVVAELSPAALGCAGAAELARRVEDDLDLGDEFNALRDNPASRWLALAVNGPVLVNETTAAGERVVSGGAALTVAALLATSLRLGGTFARFGRDADLRAPGTCSFKHGQEDIPIGTGEPLSATAQLALASRGLVAVGGPQQSDLLTLAACPIVHRSEDATSLPGQLLAGRTVRFALWVRERVPAGASAEEAANTVTHAAALMLLPGTPIRPRFGAALAKTDSGAELKIAASYPAALTGAPVTLSFALPLS
jgi:type VI secretion system protein ImpC